MHGSDNQSNRLPIRMNWLEDNTVMIYGRTVWEVKATFGLLFRR